MTQEALKLAIQLQDTASGYWTENEITIIEQLIEALAQTQEPLIGCVNHDCEKCKAQRTWVGLTNDELTDLFYNTNLGQASAVAQAIALLKQKNGYAEEKNNGV